MNLRVKVLTIKFGYVFIIKIECDVNKVFNVLYTPLFHSMMVTRWRYLGHALKMDPFDMDKFKLDIHKNQKDVADVVREMLAIWAQRNEKEAKLSALVSCLEEIHYKHGAGMNFKFLVQIAT